MAPIQAIVSGNDAALLVVIVSALIAPTWLAWWSSHQARHEAAAAKMQGIKLMAQTQPNGGSSLRDVVDRIDRQVSVVSAHILINEQRLTDLEHQSEATKARSVAQHAENAEHLDRIEQAITPEATP